MAEPVPHAVLEAATKAALAANILLEAADELAGIDHWRHVDAVLVVYGDQRHLLFDGDGRRKVTVGHGGPRAYHASLPIRALDGDEASHSRGSSGPARLSDNGEGK